MLIIDSSPVVPTTMEVCLEIEKEEKTEEEPVTWNDVVNHEGYLAHFTSNIDRGLDAFIVVLWKTECGRHPDIYCHENKAVQYFSVMFDTLSRVPQNDDIFWGRKKEAFPVSNDWQAEYIKVNEIVQRNARKLFQQHSLLVGLQPLWKDDHYEIQFTVICNQFKPIHEPVLPTLLEGYKVSVIEGYFALAGTKHLRKMTSIEPGVSLAPSSLSVLNKRWENMRSGTLGGFIQHDGKLYGVTCGHVCYDFKSKQMYPTETHIMHPNGLGLLLGELNHNERDIVMEERDHIIRNGEYPKFELARRYREIESNQADQYVQCINDQCESIGTLIGGIFGYDSNDTSAAFDVAVIELSNTVSIQTQGISSPTARILDMVMPNLLIANMGEYLTVAIDTTTAFPGHELKIFGVGGSSNSTFEGKILLQENRILCREWSARNDGPIFNCFIGDITRNWKAGDSGTWIWTGVDENNNQVADKAIVGMGIGSMNGKIIILPMKSVIEGVNHVLMRV